MAMGILDKLRRMVCRHQFDKIKYLSNIYVNSKCVGVYRSRCSKCGHKIIEYGQVLFPFTFPCKANKGSEYDKSVEGLTEEIRSAQQQVDKLVALRKPNVENKALEKTIVKRWRHILTCSMWMEEAQEEEYIREYEKI